MTSLNRTTAEALFHCHRSAEARRIVAELQSAGFVAYFAGGCVRDALLGIPPKDFDVATDATPAAVRELFGKRNTLAFGAAFGVIGVLPPRRRGEDDETAPTPREPTEVATFRSDGDYSDGRRPDSVHYGDAMHDALRRDFTINGLFYDPAAHEVIDYVEGQADLRRGVLRTIGDPEQRFDEDKLRMLRAIRFATVLRFRKEPRTFEAIRKHASGILMVSGERIGAEMRRVVVAEGAVEGLVQLLGTGLAEYIWPDLGTIDLGAARRRHRQLVDRSVPTALACLLLSGPEPGAMLSDLGRLWRLSNEETRVCEAAIRHWQTVVDADRRPWSEVQPVLVDRDAEPIVEVAGALALADRDKPDGSAGVRLARSALAWPRERLDPPPLVNGEDLRDLGLEPGPDYRRILHRIRAAQLNGELTTRAEALAEVERIENGEN